MAREARHPYTLLQLCICFCVCISFYFSFCVGRYRSMSTDLFLLAFTRCSYRCHASSISGKKAEKAIFSIGCSVSGISQVSRYSQQARRTLTAVSGGSCFISCRRSIFSLNHDGCFSLISAIQSPPRHNFLPSHLSKCVFAGIAGAAYLAEAAI